MYVLKYIYVRLVIFVLFSFNLLIDVAAPLFPSLTPTVAVSALSAWLSADLLVWEQCSVFALIPPWASSIGTRVLFSALLPLKCLRISCKLETWFSTIFIFTFTTWRRTSNRCSSEA